MKKLKTKLLLQSQIEAAMRVTRSNRAAAEYLRVSYNFYKKFAKSYFNSQGVSLFDAHLNKAGRGIIKTHISQQRHKLDDILLGKHPTYAREKLFNRLLINGYIEEKCKQCGYCQKRPTDLRAPLILNHINGDRTDHRLENLEVLCFNCYFVYVGHMTTKDVKHMSMYMSPEPQYKDDPRNMIDSPESLAALSTMDLLTDEEKMDLINRLNNI
jgi:hypothetical protein